MRDGNAEGPVLLASCSLASDGKGAFRIRNAALQFLLLHRKTNYNVINASRLFTTWPTTDSSGGGDGWFGVRVNNAIISYPLKVNFSARGGMYGQQTP